MSLIEYITAAKERGAADLFILAGTPCCIRLGGKLVPLDDQKLLPDDTKALIMEIYALANRETDRYFQTWDDDFSFALPGLARFRVNTYRQRGSMAAVIRVV